MKKLYLLSSDSYSDYTVIGVYDDKALAEEEAKNHQHVNDIEEVFLNVPSAKTGYLWFVVCKKDFTIVSIVKNSTMDFHNKVTECIIKKEIHYRVTVFAKDETKAIKIANDLFHQYKATENVRTIT
jgi:hypothetical protein